MSAGAVSGQDVEGLVGELYGRVRKAVLERGTPLSTYRLQLHKGFTFDQAREALPYLAQLGVSDVYCSPYLKAAPGSTHGYDCVDHKQLNPEVGSTEQHRAFCDRARELGLGQVLDVVPNHMGIESFNPLWFDVLENGPSSIYARFFDIDWHPVKDELQNKVLLPVLGDQYGVVLERGELKLGYRDGAFFIHYYDRLLPLEPRRYERVLSWGLETLEGRLGAEHPHVIELRSILTAISHLPERWHTEPEHIIERNREKEVIKRRLRTLVAASREVEQHVEACVSAFNGTPGNARSFDELDELLRDCSYRLAYWRVAVEEINYRRFFDINGLAAIRVEEPQVFAEAHQRVFDWLREGRVTGLRIDHPDGLYDPTAYFLDLQEQYFVERARALFETEQAGQQVLWPEVSRRLRERWRQEAGAQQVNSPLRKALYVAVEKIQGGRERIPEDWAVHGTTGYRFANAVGGLFVQSRAEGPMTDTYHRFIGTAPDFQELVYEKKRLILRDFMASELNMLADRLNRISEMNRRTRDFTLNSLRRALAEFIALFPVYRTYVDGWRPELDERDVRYIEDTIRAAKERISTLNASIFDFLGDVLLCRYPDHLGEHERRDMLTFAMKLQQVTGPVMAKGLEDTSFYIYHRLTSLNEVGGEPELFGTSADIFHERNQERAQHWPASMLTTSTHDTKRSEDVRARINVLSELPEVWRERVTHWTSLTRTHRTELPSGPAPSLNDEYLFYQTVVGALPMGPELSGEPLEHFRDRIREYMLKAGKEAKVHTSWTNSNPDYENGVSRFVEACLDEGRGRAFLDDVRAFKRRIERAGQHNALGQQLLKFASPGAADTYQGCELWDLSLVDPDNRRPVDYALRSRLLAELDEQARRDRPGLCARLFQDMDDGRIKLYLVAELLRLRKRQPALFRHGSYRALGVSGPRAEAVVALAREQDSAVIIAAAPRYTLSALEAPGGWVSAHEETALDLPAQYASMTFRDVFTGQEVRAGRQGEGARLPLSPLLASFPVVLLERSDG